METHMNYWKLSTIVLALVVLAGVENALPGRAAPPDAARRSVDIEKLAENVIPEDGVALPIRWGNLGKRMVEAGVIDTDAFNQLYAGRGGLSAQGSAMLGGDHGEPVVIGRENAGELLNLFWALGLGNANPILADAEEMMNPAYGGAGGFAATGGWTLANGDPLNHYNAHALVSITPEEQSLVERVSENIHRPCCGNSAHFPDCNHGMAMLGLLELLAANGASEEEMYETALAANSYWFPDTYLVIGQYLAEQGTAWEDADPKEILGVAYSSAEGYQRIMSMVEGPVQNGGGSCGA